MQYMIFLIILAINALVPDEVPEVGIIQDRTKAIISNLTLMDSIASKEEAKNRFEGEVEVLRKEVSELRKRAQGKQI